MADWIDRKVAIDALGKIQYWNPEDCYRAKKAVEQCPVVEKYRPAEEMLRELGYYLHPEKENCYEHAEELERIIIEDDGVWFDDDGWRFKVGIREILAVAQLIKEKEAGSK